MPHALFNPTPLSGLKLDRNPNIREEMQSMEDFTQHYPIIITACFDDSIAINTKSYDLRDAPHAQWQHLAQEQDLIYLGLWDEQAYFAWICPDKALCAQENIIWENVRALEKHLSIEQLGFAALAMGMARWHAQTKFCTQCGSLLTRFLWGEGRICTNEACDYIAYPSHISPSMIALVTAMIENEEKLLIIQHSNPKMPRWTLPSGFVSMGEAFEETVTREVFEETGVICGDVHYLANQPWTIGKSLMIGCSAKAKETNIAIDEKEISAAQWVSRTELSRFSEEQLPPKFSISSCMICYWLENS